MVFVKGKSGNPKGKPKGTVSATTTEFKTALNRLLEESAPNMVQWLERVAAQDPGKALDTLGKLAEYIYPKLQRSTLVGDPDEPLQMKSITETDKDIINRYLQQQGADKNDANSH